jgi:hypothetical protein
MTTNFTHEGIPMELDELKSAWQALDRKLELENMLRLDDLRERKLGKVNGSLRPLFWGQIAQILFGIPFIALAALLWMTGPESASVIAAGVVLHAYGVITIITASVVLGQIAKIDYAAPVLRIQKLLARLRALYFRSGMLAGLPWWFLWVVVLMVIAGLGGVDLLATEPALIASGLGIGAAGIGATWWFHRRVRRAERADLGRRMDAGLAGGSLRNAQAQLDALMRFEQE